MNKLTLEWFQAALIRAIKTIAQTAVGMIAVGAAIYEVNWSYVISVSVVAGVVSLLTSIGGLPEATPVGTYIIKDENGDGEIDFDYSAALKSGKTVCIKIDDKTQT